MRRTAEPPPCIPHRFRPDGRTNHGKALLQEMALVPEGHVDRPPEEVELER